MKRTHEDDTSITYPVGPEQRMVIPRYLFSSGIYDVRERPWQLGGVYIRDGDLRLAPAYRWTANDDNSASMVFYNPRLTSDFVEHKLAIIKTSEKIIGFEKEIIALCKQKIPQFTTDNYLKAVGACRKRKEAAERDKLFSAWGITRLCKNVRL